MTVPDLADPRPPYQQISADLRMRIRKGDPAAGDKLPSNKALADQYGTSTETIRRALRVLADEGLIKAHSTMGTYVMRQDAAPLSTEERLAKLEKRFDDLECQVMDTRAAAGLDQAPPEDQAAAR